MLVRWVRRVSLYFSQLLGNGALSETGSLMTASSSLRPRQGELLRDGNRVRHFCIVTNRSDPKPAAASS